MPQADRVKAPQMIIRTRTLLPVPKRFGPSSHSEGATPSAEGAQAALASGGLPARDIPTGEDHLRVDPTPRDRRERSDTYSGEILRSGGWRVTVCRDGIQWLLQRRRKAPGESAIAAWTTAAHCVTRTALLRLWRAHTGGDGADLLGLLPERFNRSNRDRSFSTSHRTSQGTLGGEL